MTNGPGLDHQQADHDDDRHDAQRDEHLDREPALVADGLMDLGVVLLLGGELVLGGHAEMATFPVFSVLSQVTSAPRSCLTNAAHVTAHSSARKPTSSAPPTKK